MKTARSPQGRSLKYQQLADHFREQVQSGKLKPGHQLPSFAQMQSEHGVGQGTLERVYSLLESEKLIVRQPKRGTFVAQTANRVGLNVIGVASGRSPREHPYYSQILAGIQEV